jgi:hypothetical protein
LFYLRLDGKYPTQQFYNHLTRWIFVAAFAVLGSHLMLELDKVF